jgi:hypothetical protein
MESRSFERFGGWMAILAGLAGLVYLVSFLMLGNPAALVPALMLLLVGVFGSAAIVALYARVKKVDHGFALWGLLLGMGGAGGAAIHSAFDLSNNLHAPVTPFDYASPIDPRGFLTFAVAGLAAIVLSALVVRGGVLSRGLGYLGIIAGILLVALYAAYLVILNPTNPLVLGLVLLSGVLQPIWYLWLGVALQQPMPRGALYRGPERRAARSTDYYGVERRSAAGS